MGFVYIMRNGAEDVVKIGRARDVESRRGQFMTGNPEALTVIDSVETDEAGLGERFLHGRYQSRRIRGEFFALTHCEAQEAGQNLRAFLAEHVPLQREAEELGRIAPTDAVRAPSAEEQVLRRRLVEAREARYRADLECARIENELRVSIGKAEGLAGLVTWKAHVATRFNEAAFRESHPDLHGAFLDRSTQRAFRLVWA